MSGIIDHIKMKFSTANALLRIIVINVSVFLVINFFYVCAHLFKLSDIIVYDLLNWIGVPSNLLSLAVRPWTVITYMFVHEDLRHIFFNMLILYFAGLLFSEYLGNRKLVSTYFLGGLSGALFYIIAYNIFPVFESELTFSQLIGASASILAILVAIATLIPDYEVQLIFFTVKLKYIAIFMVLLSFISIPDGNAGGEFAHLGGALYGFLYITQIRKGRDLAYGFDKIARWVVRIFKRNKKKSMEHSYARAKPDEAFLAARKSKQERVDEILDKIGQSGYDSLTKEEKDFLFNVSKNNKE